MRIRADFTPDISHEGKIGEVFFFAACYTEAADQEVTLSCLAP